MSDLSVGFSKRQITPPIGTQMMGYANRTEGCRGVYDDLYVRALALKSGDERALILAFDVSAFGRSEVATIREAMKRRLGLDAERLIINTSHTHAGPITTQRRGVELKASPEYMATLFETVAMVGEKAFASLRPTALSVGEAPLDIGGNRRFIDENGKVTMALNPDGPSLKNVTVWRFRFDDGGDVVVFSSPYHGVTMGPRNLYVSTEWMGIAVREIERESEGCSAMFLQGCAGDQNCLRDRGDYEQVVDNGTKAAAAVMEALGDLTEVAASPLTTTGFEVDVPVSGGGTFPVGICGIRLGDVVLMGLDGEPFVEYALHVRRHAAGTSAMALGYTNGSAGYLVTSNTNEEGGYEAGANRVFEVEKPWDPEMENVLKEALSKALKTLGCWK